MQGAQSEAGGGRGGGPSAVWTGSLCRALLGSDIHTWEPAVGGSPALPGRGTSPVSIWPLGTWCPRPWRCKGWLCQSWHGCPAASQLSSLTTRDL